MITDINSEDRLVQKTFADHLQDHLGWESVYAYNTETFGPEGTLGRKSEREAVLVRDLRAALERLNPDTPASAREQAVEKLTRMDFARSLLQHNREFYGFIRGGVPVEWRDGSGETHHAHARLIDFSNGKAADGQPNNRFPGRNVSQMTESKKASTIISFSKSGMAMGEKDTESFLIWTMEICCPPVWLFSIGIKSSLAKNQ